MKNLSIYNKKIETMYSDVNNESLNLIFYTLNQLLIFNLYLGHSFLSWNLYNSFFFLGFRKKYAIINLNKTYFLFKKSLFIIKDIVKQNGYIIIINSDKLGESQQFNIYKYLFTNLKNNFLSFFNFYFYGLITNYRSWYNRFIKIRKLSNLIIKKDKKKKIKTLILNNSLFCKVPSFLFIAGRFNLKNAIKEGNKFKISVSSVFDSNMNLNDFKSDYIIPGNDDNIDSLIFYFSFLKFSIYFGLELKYQNFVNLNFLKLIKGLFKKSNYFMNYKNSYNYFYRFLKLVYNNYEVKK